MPNRVIVVREKIENLSYDELFVIGTTLYRFITVATFGSIPVMAKREHPEKGFENYCESFVKGLFVTVFRVEQN